MALASITFSLTYSYRQAFYIIGTIRVDALSQLSSCNWLINIGQKWASLPSGRLAMYVQISQK